MPRSLAIFAARSASMMMPPSWGVPDLKLVLEAQRDVAEVATLKANERPLAVIEPRDVVRRADVHIARIDLFLQLAGDGLRLRDLLRLEALALQHVHEVHVAADVELVRAIDGHAAIFEQLREHAVGDGGADLALDVVTNDRDAAFSNFSAHSGVPAMNTGSALTKATPASIAHCA